MDISFSLIILLETIDFLVYLKKRASYFNNNKKLEQ